MVYQPLADAHADKSWDMAVPAHLTPPRPLRLFEPAEPVYVVALLPDHPPCHAEMAQKNWQIIRATGPERIGPRWWDADQKGIKPVIITAWKQVMAGGYGFTAKVCQNAVKPPNGLCMGALHD